MSGSDREAFLQGELTCFLIKNSAEEATISAVDEIVLGYMISVLDELGSNTASEDDFDVDDFTEMMAAYLPGFEQIHRVAVSEWMFELVNKLKELLGTSQSVHEGSPFDEFSFSLKPDQLGFGSRKTVDTGVVPSKPVDLVPNPYPAGRKPRRTSSRTISTSSSTSSTCREDDLATSPLAELTNGIPLAEGDDFSESEEEDEQVRMLREMFPNAVSMEITHCLGVANGGVEQAAQLILLREETGESIKSNNSGQVNKAGLKFNGRKIDDQQVKKEIISRYSYVDVNEYKKVHKPLPVAQKREEKKMVRYLDSKVVSTKGERFTEVKKSEDEAMKATYVNLKPAKQYRFH